MLRVLDTYSLTNGGGTRICSTEVFSNSCDRRAQAPKYIVECFGVLRWTRQRECFGVLMLSEVLCSSEVDKMFAFQTA